MSHSGRMGTCPACTGPAHHCDDGSIYCGDADVTMTAEQVEQALAARDIARRVIDGASLHRAVAEREAANRLAKLEAEVRRREVAS